MAIMGERIRNQIRTYIPPDMLTRFEILAATTDELWEKLDQEKVSSVSWGLAIDWASSVLALARMESALLSGILPHLEASMNGGVERAADIQSRREVAMKEVYDLRGADGFSVRPPLNPERDTQRAEASKAAKLKRNTTLKELGVESRAISAEQEPAKKAIAQIELSLRALKHYVNTRFPQPIKPTLNPMTPSVVDDTVDPLQAFATRWVEGLKFEGSPEAKAIRALKERDRKAKARPKFDPDKAKADHVAKVKAREAERVRAAKKKVLRKSGISIDLEQ